MIVKNIYISDDGMEFQSEWECVEHEAEIRANKFKDTALLFNAEGEPLVLTEEGFEKAWFIRCKTKEAAEYLYHEFGNIYSNPWCGSHTCALKAGCWCYSGEEWLDIEELKRLANIVKLIMEGEKPLHGKED